MTRRSLLSSSTLVALLWLSGCGSAPPIDPMPVDLTLPEAYTAPGTRAAAVDTLETPWWIPFGDVRLDSLVTRALAHNRSLEAAAARLDQAAALARIAGADLYPQVSGRASARRQKQNFIGLPIPGRENDVLSTTVTNYGVGLDVSWEIDLWGRIRAGRSAAQADFQGAHADFAGAALSLTAQTAKTWFALVEAGQQLALAETTLATYRESARQVRERFNLGVRSSLDLRLALAQFAGAEALVEARRIQLDRVRRQLEVLLGGYPESKLFVAPDLPPVPAPVPAGLPAELLSRRPDLARAERRIAASDRRTAEAKRSLLPRLSLTGSAGTASGELGDLVDGDFSVWSLAGNLVAPLFQGGRLRANVDLNRARQEESVALFAETALRAFAEVENTLFAEDALARQERSLAEAALQSEAARRVAEEQYRFGLVDYVVVLESQRRELVSRSELLSVRRARLDARVDLHLALGGGFSVRNLPGVAPEEPGDNAHEKGSS